MEIARICKEIPLNKIRKRQLKPGISLRNAKEAFKIRNEKVEHGVTTLEMADKFYKLTSISDNAKHGQILAVSIGKNHANMHNHKTEAGFSYHDIYTYTQNARGHNSMVSTDSTLFYFKAKKPQTLLMRLNKRFNPIQKYINKQNMQKQNNYRKGFDKDLNAIIDAQNEMNDAAQFRKEYWSEKFYQEMKNSHSKEEHAKIIKDPQALHTAYEAAAKRVLERQALYDAKKLAQETKEFANIYEDRLMTKASFKANWDYRKYSWAEIFPGVIKSRGKK